MRGLKLRSPVIQMRTRSLSRFLIGCLVIATIMTVEVSVWYCEASMELGAWLTTEELRTAPDYCRVRETSLKPNPMLPSPSRDEAERWRSILGDGYIHVHHYCRGVNWILRHNRYADVHDQNYENHRRHALNRALTEFEYVSSRVDNGFPLLPELYFNRATAYQLLGRYREAVGSLGEAVALKMDYLEAYLALGDLLAELGDSKEALAVFELGRQQAGATEALERRIRALKADTTSGSR